MARIKMVSRTIKGTEANVMVVNTMTGETTVQSYVLGESFMDEKALLKAIQKAYDTEELKAVRIVESKQVETRYGMAESEFIKLATVMPPLTKKQ